MLLVHEIVRSNDGQKIVLSSIAITMILDPDYHEPGKLVASVSTI